MEPSDVVGRSRELGDLDALLHNPERFPLAIEIDGEAGIGKSTIWRWAVERAREVGYACLEARPAEAEATLAFAALGDLLEPAIAEIGAAIPVPQQRALHVALLLDDAGGSPNARTIGVALLSALRALAARRPVVIAIDDEQWLDAASAAVLGFALRRLRSEPIAVVAARRAGAPGPRLDTRLPTTVVEVGGLSMGALHAVVVDRLGMVLSRPRLRRVHELSRGNPFLALELLRSAAAGRFDLDAEEPTAADLDRLVGARLDDLPLPTRAVLLAAAAASRPTLTLLQRSVGDGAIADLRPAEAAGIVEVRGSDVRFTHPLLASAAYGAGTADDRRAAHGRLALVVDEPVERARHLALAMAEPDAEVAAEVERAADLVFRRGAPAAAAGLAARAARLTPGDDDAGLRRRRAAEASYLFEAGDTPAAARLTESLVDASPPGIERARLLALLARIRHFHRDIGAGSALNELALDDATGDDRLVASLHEGLAWGRFLMRDDLRSAARHGVLAVEAAERTADPIALGEALAARAVTSLAVGVRDDDLLQRALALEPAFRDLRVLRHPSYAHGYVLACSDDLDGARQVFLDLLDRAEEHGDESAVPSILVQLSMVELLAGNWAVAEELAARGDTLAEQGEQRPSQAALRGRRALLAVLRGRAAAGQALAEQALAMIDDGPPATGSGGPAFARGGEVATWALGAAHLVRGQFLEAHRSLGPLTDGLLGSGLREPGELRFLPDAVEALLGLGDRDAAARLVGEMESMAATTARATSRGLSARSRALVLAHDGDLDGATRAAEDAVRLLESDALPFELARARLVLGSLLRRQRSKRAARETLDAAHSTFEALGADGWAVTSAAELDRIGGRSAAAGGLTNAEARVAGLVATGLANKEIASALGVSTKTVELHLSHVYTKLDVGSRTELVRRLATGSPEGNP